MESVYEFLKSLNIINYDTLVVAVSYGPDSMTLLNVIKKIFFKNKIVCAHVHHNHRKESDNEFVLLKKTCEDNNIVFEYMKIENYTNNKFTEGEARNKRYVFFDEVMKKYDAKYLFTAHHGDDLVETVLMRLVRGSTMSGYAGIPLISERSNYKLIRPFLYVTKDDILNYCELNNIKYAVDNSNFSDDYTRNRYRKYILPQLKKENKNVHKKFLKFSTVLLEYENYIKRIVDNEYKNVVTKNIIDCKEIMLKDDLIKKRIIMKYLLNYYDLHVSEINNHHIEAVLRLIKSSKPNGFICLPNEKKLVKSYNKIYFDNSYVYNDYCVILDKLINLPNNYVIETIDKLENTTNYVTAFNKKDLVFPLVVRNVRDGDKIEVLGLNGSKKIHDIFINEKVPKELRNSYPVLMDGNENIIWLPGLKKSKYDKSKTGNYDIILKYYKEEKNDSTK